MAINQMTAPQLMDSAMAKFGIPASKTEKPEPEGNGYQQIPPAGPDGMRDPPRREWTKVRRPTNPPPGGDPPSNLWTTGE